MSLRQVTRRRCQMKASNVWCELTSMIPADSWGATHSQNHQGNLTYSLGSGVCIGTGAWTYEMNQPQWRLGKTACFHGSGGQERRKRMGEPPEVNQSHAALGRELVDCDWGLPTGVFSEQIPTEQKPGTKYLNERGSKMWLQISSMEVRGGKAHSQRKRKWIKSPNLGHEWAQMKIEREKMPDLTRGFAVESIGMGQGWEGLMSASLS